MTSDSFITPDAAMNAIKEEILLDMVENIESQTTNNDVGSEIHDI